jgi:hypothetical protein
MKIGDIGYAYEKGLHIIEDITDGCGSGKCIHLRRVLDSRYNKSKGKSMCDSAYWIPTTKEEVKRLIENYTKEALKNVEELL